MMPFFLTMPFRPETAAVVAEKLEVTPRDVIEMVLIY
jgi:hypothetical protein